MVEVELRDVTVDDLPILFEHQRDPQATEMAAFPSRDWDAFRVHWTTKILGDPTVFKQTVLVDGAVAGNVGSWLSHGEREVGYWIGRDHWGQGVASTAVALFLEQVRERPVVAYVAKHNTGSLRVLAKCGFTVVREQQAADGITEVVLTLD